MSTPAEFAAKMRRMAVDLEAAQPRAVRAGAELVASRIRAGTPSRLRHAGAVGVTVDAPVPKGAGASCRVRGTGSFKLIEESIRAHDIKPKAKKAIVVAGAPKAGAHHPGVHRSSGPFKRGVAIGAPEVPQTINKTVVEVMSSILG